MMVSGDYRGCYGLIKEMRELVRTLMKWHMHHDTICLAVLHDKCPLLLICEEGRKQKEEGR